MDKKRGAVMLEYEEYLKQLPEGQLGKIEVTQKDGIKPQIVRARLVRASKNFKIDTEIKRVGNTILFWKTT